MLNLFGDEDPAPVDPAEGFDAFWKVYPRKVGKANAKQAFIALLKSRKLPPIEELVRIVERQTITTDSWHEDKKWIPFPATWLNGERWLDELPEQTEREREAAIWTKLTEQYRREGL
jgi:hypothetical protein